MTTLRPGRYDVSAELERLQEGQPLRRAARRGRRISVEFTLEPGSISETVTVVAAGHADPDRRGHPEDRRGEGHRAAVVLGPQPDWRARAEAGRGRRQLQQRGLRGLQQRRLQHQRQPGGREHDHGRRRGRHPHAVGGHDHRRPERRRDPGSAGADGQLPARVRPGERRADPVHHQERQQPVLRQRVVLLARRQRSRPTPGRATAARTPSRTAGRRRSTTSSTATRSAGRSRASGSRTSSSSSPRRSGWTSSRSSTNTVTVPTEAMRQRRLQPAAGHEPVLQHARRSSATRSPACRSRATSSRRTACRRTASR